MVWFETILVVLTLLTGVIWLLDKLFFAKRRAARSDLLDEEPVLVDYSRAFFPVLAAVLILRSFIAEPYKIPSSSMMPNLLIGDFILVNKFAYGLRLPINNQKFLAIGEPARGDVVVFKPPHDPENNWIKRVIGLPGDKVGFHGDTVYLNGQPLKYEQVGDYVGAGRGSDMTGAALLREELPGRTHTVLEWLGSPPPGGGEGDWVVPPGHYFVMGDNRDNSLDGRFWEYHFLPEENLRGKAFLIWLNCEGWVCKNGFDPSRIGNGIQ
jgi:signal peptidase I